MINIVDGSFGIHLLLDLLDDDIVLLPWKFAAKTWFPYSECGMCAQSGK